MKTLEVIKEVKEASTEIEANNLLRNGWVLLDYKIGKCQVPTVKTLVSKQGECATSRQVPIYLEKLNALYVLGRK